MSDKPLHLVGEPLQVLDQVRTKLTDRTATREDHLTALEAMVSLPIDEAVQWFLTLSPMFGALYEWERRQHQAEEQARDRRR